MKKPNILMIMTDQQKFDAVSYQEHYLKLTPNLDRLAEESMVFTNAYTPAPTCGPARAAIQTGMYPAVCGVVENLSAAREGTEFLAERLLRVGYDTGLSGKLHFSPPDKSYGFNFKKLHDAPYSVYADEDQDSLYIKWLQEKYKQEDKGNPVKVFDEDESSYDSNIGQFIMGSNFRTKEEHDIPWTVDGAIEFLEQRDKNKPFFLITSFFGPHHPYGVPEPWNSLYNPEDIKLPENFYADMTNSPIFQIKAAPLAKRLKKTFKEEDYKRAIAANYGQVNMIDYYIGKLLNYLKNNNIYEETVIIFTSDHGDFLGSYGLFFKTHMYDSCTKVPMLIKLPHGENGHEIKNEVINTLDLYGTILDFAKDKDWQNEQVESRSLMPILYNIGDWDNTTYSMIGNRKERINLMMRSGKYKINRLERGEELPLYEIYDLENDPEEIHNIEETLEIEIKNNLNLKLEEWMIKQKQYFPNNIISYRK